MKDVISAPGGTGRSAQFQNIQMPIAGKTGTTNEDKELCFAAYTPYYSASIYMGYDKRGEPMDSRTKIHHLQLWRHIMEQVHTNLPYKDFEKPEDVISLAVCKCSGKLAAEACGRDPRGSMVHNELFKLGTEPLTECDVHRTVRIDTSTGYLANAYCPPQFVEWVTGIVKPNKYEGNATIADSPFELSPYAAMLMVCPVHGNTVPEPTLEPTTEPEPIQD